MLTLALLMNQTIATFEQVIILDKSERCYTISNQKQPSCKKRCGPQKGHGEKRCEIQGGGQEMAVMVG